MPKQPPEARRILVFDSGIGGLSILQSAYKHSPQHHYSYFADNAWRPYGPRSAQNIQQRLLSLFQAIDVENNFDIVVLACNTASTSALAFCREHFSLPFIGVVPAIKPAALLSQSKTIALLATQTTVSGNYVKALGEQHASDCQMINFALPELVELVEYFLRQPKSNQADSYFDAKLDDIIQTIKSHPQSSNIDSFVLGCTHFPLLKTFMASRWGRPANWIDSGDAIALRIQKISLELSNSYTQSLPSDIHRQLLTTSENSCDKNHWFPYFKSLGIQQAQTIENVN